MLEPIQKVRPHVPPQHEVYAAAKKEAESDPMAAYLNKYGG